MQRTRESPTYIPLGMDRESLLRLPASLKAEFRHLQKLSRIQLATKTRLGPRIDGKKPPKMPATLEDALADWKLLPLRSVFKEMHDTAYRGLPPASLGEFIRHGAMVGMGRIRETYFPK